MSDILGPFDAVTPIGDPRPPQLRLSRREKRVRERADHSELPGPASLRSTDAETGQPKAPRRSRLTPTMTVEEALAMVERVARRAYRITMAPDTAEVVGADGVRKRVAAGPREGDRKHAATALGIAIDKWTMLSGRPTQIHELRGEARAGLKALALRVLQGGGGAA